MPFRRDSHISYRCLQPALRADFRQLKRTLISKFDIEQKIILNCPNKVSSCRVSFCQSEQHRPCLPAYLQALAWREGTHTDTKYSLVQPLNQTTRRGFLVYNQTILKKIADLVNQNPDISAILIHSRPWLFIVCLLDFNLRKPNKLIFVLNSDIVVEVNIRTKDFRTQNPLGLSTVCRTITTSDLS